MADELCECRQSDISEKKCESRATYIVSVSYNDHKYRVCYKHKLYYEFTFHCESVPINPKLIVMI